MLSQHTWGEPKAQRAAGPAKVTQLGRTERPPWSGMVTQRLLAWEPETGVPVQAFTLGPGKHVL